MTVRAKLNPYVLVVVTAILVYYALVCVWPFAFNIYLTLRKTDLLTEDKFVGLNNYRYLFRDPIFWRSLRNNLYYLATMVSIGIVTSLVFAWLIAQTAGTVRKIYTAMYFMPVVTSMVAVSLVWQLLYFPKIGLFALLLSRLFGLDPNNLTFLQNPATALICIIVMDIWKDSGLRTAVFLAGIDEIPDSLYEAARIEGASEWRQFLSITIPLLRPQIIFLAAIYSINAIRVYVPIYMMTGNPPGGPANSTKVLAIQMYQEAFYGMRFGYGATVAMVIFVLLMGLVILEIRAFEQKWEY